MLKVEDYYDLLAALDAGFGIDPQKIQPQEQKEAFHRLCSLMWVKSPAEAELFEQQFALFLAEDSQPTSSSPENLSGRETDPEVAPTISDPTSTDPDAASPEEEPSPPIDQPLEIPAPEIQAPEPQEAYQPPKYRFLISQKYFPITQREMQQSWRHLHRPERIGLSTQMNIPATVQDFARNGYLEKPIYQYEYENQVQLHILVDVGGSMIAFDTLCSQLVATAREGGRVQEVSDHYFRNIPKNRIYTDPARTSWTTVEELFQSLDPLRSSVLIISDAGAARGNRNLQRLYHTEGFLEELHHKTLRIAWLNPFPPQRWKGNSAAQIAKWVAMFPIDRSGLDQAIEILKGKISD